MSGGSSTGRSLKCTWRELAGAAVEDGTFTGIVRPRYRSRLEAKALTSMNVG